MYVFNEKSDVSTFVRPQLFDFCERCNGRILFLWQFFSWFHYLRFKFPTPFHWNVRGFIDEPLYIVELSLTHPLHVCCTDLKRGYTRLGRENRELKATGKITIPSNKSRGKKECVRFSTKRLRFKLPTNKTHQKPYLLIWPINRPIVHLDRH